MLATVQMNRFGHLVVTPKNKAFQHISLYFQSDFDVEEFIGSLVPARKRNELREGWDITIRIDSEYFSN